MSKKSQERLKEQKRRRKEEKRRKEFQDRAVEIAKKDFQEIHLEADKRGEEIQILIRKIRNFDEKQIKTHKRAIRREIHRLIVEEQVVKKGLKKLIKEIRSLIPFITNQDRLQQFRLFEEALEYLEKEEKEYSKKIIKDLEHVIVYNELLVEDKNPRSKEEAKKEIKKYDMQIIKHFKELHEIDNQLLERIHALEIILLRMVPDPEEIPDPITVNLAKFTGDKPTEVIIDTSFIKLMYNYHKYFSDIKFTRGNYKVIIPTHVYKEACVFTPKDSDDVLVPRSFFEEFTKAFGAKVKSIKPNDKEKAIVLDAWDSYAKGFAKEKLDEFAKKADVKILVEVGRLYEHKHVVVLARDKDINAIVRGKRYSINTQVFEFNWNYSTKLRQVV